MPVSRKRAKGARASFGLALPVFLLMPNMIGYQDISSRLARQPSVVERWKQNLVASPFGTIRAATFSLPRPLGTTIPEPIGFRLAALNPGDNDITGSLGDADRIEREPQQPSVPLEFPTFNRARKGDLLVPRARFEQPPQPPAESQPKSLPNSRPMRSSTTASDNSETNVAAPLASVDASFDATPLSSSDKTMPMANAPARSTDEATPVRAERMARRHETSAPDNVTTLATRMAPKVDAAQRDALVEPEMEPQDIPGSGRTALDASPAITTARLFFNVDRLGVGPDLIEPWAPGEQPLLGNAPNIDPDIKLAALTPRDPDPDVLPGGETIATKGQVNGSGQRPKSPAERLALTGANRAKQEKCLADAIYFESRGEVERGQKAVAQVVVNRVFSGFYPDSVCGVVYQNAHRHLSCQFTFACDGIPDKITEPELWAQANRIARDTLDGKIYLPEIGKATHYHASWVSPWWVRTMRKLNRIGVHTFYRPTKWGNGADAPAWGGGAVNARSDVDKTEPAEGVAGNGG